MRSDRMITTVEAHTAGLPVRVVTGGVPTIPGATMEDRRQWFISHSDDLRTFLMCEPRGNGWMSGAILQPSTRADADWGVLFIEVTGVLPMCGAGTMAVATVLVEMGMVPVTEPATTVRLDTPAGLITADVDVSGGATGEVTIRNVASYAHTLDHVLRVPGFGDVTCDLAYGGNFYAFVNARDVGVHFGTTEPEHLVRIGQDVMHSVNEQVELIHPVSGYSGCEHAVILSDDSSDTHTRHALINAPGWLDRSPGGTGTSALMAVLHARGRLAVGQTHFNESFIGTRFTGRLIQDTSVGSYMGVMPTVTGQSWLIGAAQFFRAPTDPFPHGFTL